MNRIDCVAARKIHRSPNPRDARSIPVWDIFLFFWLDWCQYGECCAFLDGFTVHKDSLNEVSKRICWKLPGWSELFTLTFRSRSTIIWVSKNHTFSYYAASMLVFNFLSKLFKFQSMFSTGRMLVFFKFFVVDKTIENCEPVQWVSHIRAPWVRSKEGTKRERGLFLQFLYVSKGAIVFLWL